MEVLKIEGLKKAFGSSEVIKGIDLSVTEGKIFGFIGQNGAGKTTTMKMILGLLEKDQGEIYVCGEPVKYGETRTNRYIGYLPDVPEFYSYMTPMEYLSLCGEITGMEKEKIKKRSEELLSLVGLPISKKRIGTFSRGMKQRLGIAQALLNEPKLLICDEPTSALDPMGRMEILRILQSVKGKTTVIFSTHILSDVERICDEVAVLHGGHLVLQGPLEELKKKHRKEGLDVLFQEEKDLHAFMASEKLSSYEMERDGDGRSVLVTGKNMENIQKDVYEVLLTLQIVPQKVELLEPTMEHLFLEVVK